MSDYAEYVDRALASYEALQRVDQPDVPWEEGYVPLYAGRGPAYMEEEYKQFQESVDRLRKRPHLVSRLAERLSEQPSVDLLRGVPFGTPVSIREIADREARIVLLGDAGAGKTTALRYLAVQEMAKREDSERSLAVVVDLPRLVATGLSLPAYLEQDAQERLDLSLSKGFVDEALFDGRVLICLDELDAIVGQEARAAIVQRIESWAREYPRCRFVVTVRTKCYTPALDPDIFAHYSLVPWDGAAGEGLGAAWDALMEDTPPERSKAWLDLALAIQENHQRSFSLEEAGAWLEVGEDDSGQVEALMSEAVLESGLVRKEKERFSLGSRLLLEVLAARALGASCIEEGVDAGWERIRPHLWEPTWRETLVQTFRFLSQAHPESWKALLSRLLDAGETDPLEPALHRHMELAGWALACAQDPVALDEATRGKIVDGLLGWARDSTAAARESAFELLRRLGSEPTVLDKLMNLTEDASEEWLQEAIVLLLGANGAARAEEVVTLLEAWLDEAERSERVRQAAALALPRLSRGADLAEELERRVSEGITNRVLDSEVPTVVRTALGEALGILVSAKPSEKILATLALLGRSEDEETKIPYFVQLAAIRGLCSALTRVEDDTLLEQLWQLARDPEVEHTLRCYLSEVLGRQDNMEEAAQVLMDVIRDTKVRPPGKKTALQTLGRLGYADQEIVDELIALAEGKDRRTKDFVRLAAACALGDVGHKDLALQYLLTLFADKSIYHMVRNEAFERLSELGLSGDQALDEAAIAIVKVWADEENTTETVREHAVRTLYALTPNRESLYGEFVSLLMDKSVYTRVRRVVAELLASIPFKQKATMRHALGTPFYDPEEKSDLLRVALAQGLLRFGGAEGALPYVRAAAESDLALVRYKAALVLAEAGEMEAARSALLKLAKDGDVADVIRRDALRALELEVEKDGQLAEELSALVQEAELAPHLRQGAHAVLQAVASDQGAPTGTEPDASESCGDTP